MKGIGDLMKQAQEMQARLQETQEQLQSMEVTGESGAGLVKVTMNGRYEVRRVNLDPTVMGGRTSEDKEVLEDLIAAACNDAVRRVEQTQAEKMSELTGGINLPFGQFPS